VNEIDDVKKDVCVAMADDDEVDVIVNDGVIVLLALNVPDDDGQITAGKSQIYPYKFVQGLSASAFPFPPDNLTQLGGAEFGSAAVKTASAFVVVMIQDVGFQLVQYHAQYLPVAGVLHVAAQFGT
jgi:hypothetical protein